MAKIYKPTIKGEWRGKQGNKFYVWVVKTVEGKKHVRMTKQAAYNQYNANVRMYKKLKGIKYQV